MIGIYGIKNNFNENIYIGQAIDIENRWKCHKSALNNNKHQNSRLQNAWNKYGKDNFVFIVLDQCEESELTKREQYWIDYYGGINSSKTYNFKEAGSKGRLSNATKQKISQKQKGVPEPPGRKVSKEGRLSLSKAHKGIRPSSQTRLKMSQSQKGRKQTEETKIKIGQKNKQRYIDNPQLRDTISKRMKGRKLSVETKEKIGESSRGRKYGEETSKKHSESLKKAYKEGRRKTVKITVNDITKTQTEWAKLLDVSHTSIIYQRKKGTAELYIRKIIEKKNIQISN